MSTETASDWERWPSLAETAEVNDMDPRSLAYTLRGSRSDGTCQEVDDALALLSGRSGGGS